MNYDTGKRKSGKRAAGLAADAGSGAHAATHANGTMARPAPGSAPDRTRIGAVDYRRSLPVEQSGRFRSSRVSDVLASDPDRGGSDPGDFSAPRGPVPVVERRVDCHGRV